MDTETERYRHAEVVTLVRLSAKNLTVEDNVDLPFWSPDFPTKIAFPGARLSNSS